MNSDQQANIIHRYFEYVDNGNPDIMSLYTDDVEIFFPKFGKHKGKIAMQMFNQKMGQMFQSISHNIDSLKLMFAGNTVVVEGQESGVMHDGTAFPDYNISYGRFCNVFEFHDHLISAVRIYVDPDFSSLDTIRIQALHAHVPTLSDQTATVLTTIQLDFTQKMALVRRYFECVDQRNAQIMDLYTDNVQLSFAKFGYYHGKPAMQVFGQKMAQMLASLNHNINTLHIIDAGNAMIVEGRAWGQMADGTTFPDMRVSQGYFCNVFEFKNNLISSVHIYQDPDYPSLDQPRIQALYPYELYKLQV